MINAVIVALLALRTLVYLQFVLLNNVTKASKHEFGHFVPALIHAYPHQDSITACKEVLRSIYHYTNPEQPVEILTQLLEIGLNNNIFKFNGKLYKQLQGSAIGTRVSLAYANLFMGKLEEKIWSNSPLNPLYYKRFLHDIFMIWPFPEPTTDQLFEQMNRTHPITKFTSGRNSQRLTFLDVSVYKGQDFQYTKHLFYETYLKPIYKLVYFKIIYLIFFNTIVFFCYSI